MSYVSHYETHILSLLWPSVTLPVPHQKENGEDQSQINLEQWSAVNVSGVAIQTLVNASQIAFCELKWPNCI